MLDSRAMPEPASNKSATQQPLIGIQYLRGVAALSVAYFHLFGQIPDLTPYFNRYMLGNCDFAMGVDIFFVISGFIMFVTSRKVAPIEFLIRRIIRVAPLYWIFTLLLAAVIVWKPGMFRTTVFSPIYLLKSLFFIPYYNSGHDGDVVPMLAPGWSLNFEMFFYLIFALALGVPERFRLTLTGALFLVLVLVHLTVPPNTLGAAAWFLSDARVFEFWFGMLVAHFYLAGALRLPRWLCIALIAAGFLAILKVPIGSNDASLFKRFYATMLPAAFIVLGMVALEKNYGILRHKWLLLAGDASYSMYLSHIFALGAARALWSYMGLSGSSLIHAAGFAGFAMALVVVTAVAVYWGIEKPMTAVLHRWHKNRGARAGPAAGDPSREPIR